MRESNLRARQLQGRAKTLILLVLLALPAFSQQTQVAPDCTLGGVFTTTGNSATLDNRSVSINPGTPCTLWSLTWSAQPAVTSLTINIEGAPDSAGTPGTFTSLANATTFPSGKLTYSASTAYSPWMRITVSAVGASGLINAVLNGWREDQASIAGGGGGGGGCVGTTATPCVVDGPNSAGSASTKPPVQVAGNDGTNVQFISTDTSGRTKVVGGAAIGSSSSGNPVPLAKLDGAGNIIIPNFCTKQAAISLSSVSGENQIIALSSSTVVRICNIAVGMTAQATVSIDVGTGTNCGTGTTTLWGPYPTNTTGFTEDFLGVLLVPAGDAVCLNFGSTVTAGGGVSYAQY
jgi:hypothetical protein